MYYTLLEYVLATAGTLALLIIGFLFLMYIVAAIIWSIKAGYKWIKDGCPIE